MTDDARDRPGPRIIWPLDFVCPRCGAAVGEPCVTATGRRAPRGLEHAARVRVCWSAREVEERRYTRWLAEEMSVDGGAA